MCGLPRLEGGQDSTTSREAATDIQSLESQGSVCVGVMRVVLGEHVLPGPFFGLGISLAICRDNLFWET